MPRKKANHLFEDIADMDNLRLAFWKARKGKSYAQPVERYRSDLENNLVHLREQILTGEVEVGNYRFFKIFDPKERQICAPAFSEQVLHHALMNVCHGYFERVQIFDSYACRKGKGTYAALDRAKAFNRSGVWNETYCQRKVLPLLAFVRHADTLAWRKKIILPNRI